MKGQNANGIGAIAMLVTILLLTGQATATFELCFAACYVKCVIGIDKIPFGVPKKFLPCAWKCAKNCLIRSASNNAAYYCNIGCTMDSCADFYDGTWPIFPRFL